MRRVTSRTAFSFQRRMFEGKGTLLVRVTFYAGCIRPGREPRLLKLKTAMRVVAITTLHGSFKNLMVERLGEVRLHLTMTTQAKLRLSDLQHVER